MRLTRSRRRRRRGTAAVETAVVLPVYLLLLLGIAEFGHAQLVINLLNSGCRNGARIGSTEGIESDDIVARVKQTVGAAVPSDKITVYVKDASVFDSGDDTPTTDSALEELPDLEVEDAEPRQMFMVRAKVAYNDVCLVPMPFLRNVVLDAQAFMRHE